MAVLLLGPGAAAVNCPVGLQAGQLEGLGEVMQGPLEAPGWGLSINDKMVKKHGTVLHWDF